MSRLWNMSPLRVCMLSHSVMANSLWLMNCTPSGSSVHGALQARILEWVAMSSSRGSSQPRDQTCIPYVSYICRKVLYHMGSPITSPPLYYYSEYVFFTNQNGKKISLPHQKRKKSLVFLIKRVEVQFSSVSQLCLSSMPGLPVHHQLPEFTQIHVHGVGDASSHLFCHPLHLLHPIPPSIRVFSNESALCIRWPRIGVSASASVLPMNTQDWSPLGWTGWISLQSKGLSRVFSSTTVQKYQFLCAQLSS